MLMGAAATEPPDNRIIPRIAPDGAIDTVPTSMVGRKSSIAPAGASMIFVGPHPGAWSRSDLRTALPSTVPPALRLVDLFHFDLDELLRCDFFAKTLHCPKQIAGEVGVGGCERRHEPGVAADQVVDDADLSVAIISRADADGRHGDLRSDSFGNFSDDAFQHDCGDACAFDVARSFQ